MQRILVAFIGLALVLLSQSGDARAAALTKITDAVYAYVGVPSGTPGNVMAANAGIVIGDDAVLVVDTLTSAREAEQFIAAIRAVTDKPIRYVVNTHYHLDHALGNSAFADLGAITLAHSACRDALAQHGEATLQNPAAFSLPEDFWAGTRIVPIDLAFARQLEIDLGNQRVQIIHPGQASHSAGSVFVEVPDEGVVFTGDILFTDFHPFLAEGDLAGWANALALLASRNYSRIIPGHGPLSDAADIAAMRAYLTIFDDHARRIGAAEADAEKATAEMLAVLPPKKDGAFIVAMNMKMRYLKQNK